MPAPGDQYHGGNVKNPFEERVTNGFTTEEAARLQSKLNKQLGPEYISQRPGNGGGRVAYLEGNKAINLANEVFGFNGWSSSLEQVQIDYVDELQHGKVSLGLSIVVRITLKDGTFHEDIGYGSIENGRGKAASFEKAKKEAATDGLKRALRTFGNVLGNCLYDKEYLKKVQAIKVKPVKFTEEKLHRHADFAPPVKEEPKAIKQEAHATPIRQNQVLRTRTEHLAESFSADFDDEFDGNLFDGVDIPEQNGEEFSFETLSAPDTAAPKSIAPDPSNGRPTARTSPIRHTGPRQPSPRKQPIHTVHAQQQQPNQTHQRPPHNISNTRPPQTPLQQQNQHQSEPARGHVPPRPIDNMATPKSNGPQPQIKAQPNSNQSTGSNLPQGQQHQPPQQRPGPQPPPQGPISFTNGPQPPNHRPPVGFVTSRAAELLQQDDTTPSLNRIPAFNLYAESPIPKEQRTPGIDHARSAPTKREVTGAQPAAQPPSANAARPSAQSGGSFGRPTNFVNPHQDANRRIGMPNSAHYAMSPSANRGAYKPPTFANGGPPPQGLKRDRPVLQDVSNTGGSGNATVNAEGPDTKRPRVEAPGTENNIPST